MPRTAAGVGTVVLPNREIYACSDPQYANGSKVALHYTNGELDELIVTGYGARVRETLHYTLSGGRILSFERKDVYLEGYAVNADTSFVALPVDEYVLETYEKYYGCAVLGKCEELKCGKEKQ